MSRDHNRKYFNRDYRAPRYDRDRRELHDRDRMPERDFRIFDKNRNRSPNRGDGDKRRSRSPRKIDKDGIDDNILNEISKLPEPNELWESNHFPDNFPPPNPPPPSFDHPPDSNFPSNYQPSFSGLYDEFPPIAAGTTHLPPEWNQMSLPPAPAPAPFIPTMEEQMKKEAAIESEMRQQKAALSKQREDYIKKTMILKKELDTLKDQRNELRGDSKRSPSPDTKRFLKENTKLQLEIQNKLKTINNVVDMLNGIIGEQAQEIPDDVETTERPSKRKSRSPSKGSQFNYVYYDPEMHWCRVCNEFPSTAKDYLNHLHSPQHHKMAAAHLEAPWHSITGANEGFPNFPNASSKRTPIKGLQFFVPSTAWYCKLCDQFIGDLHCASAHLKSIVHSKNYSNFVEQNPHWETDWMSDRQRAVEKTRVAKTKPSDDKRDEKRDDKRDDKQSYAPHTITFHKDGFHTKSKKSPSPVSPEDRNKRKKEKKKKIKKKKDSSSSSSDSSGSDSETKNKKKKKEKMVESDEKVLTQWMSSIQMDRLSEHDRNLLDNLKNRIKNTETERNRSIDRYARERERERERAIAEAQRKRDGASREIQQRREDERRRDTDRRRSQQGVRRSRDMDGRSGQPKRSEADSSNDVIKKPEPKKMPFIGKMPVFKVLGKNKTVVEEQKKEETKRVEEDEALKKKREAMDVEIQKKVAEFKERLAREQVERANAVLPPELAVFYPAPAPPRPPLPPQMVAPTQIHAPAPPPHPMPNLAKDFQEALDIIFPGDGNKPGEMMKQDSILGMPPGLPGFPVGPMGGQMLNPFSHMGLVQPPMMMGFDLNRPMFPRPQLYDPPVQQNQPRIQNQPNQRPANKNNKNNNQKKAQQQIQRPKKQVSQTPKRQNNDRNSAMQKKKEEMDDLAMLGIDASDVGSGM